MADQGGVSFTRRMEIAKSQARIARNRGRHVGASAKGWNRPERKVTDPAYDDYARRAREGFRKAARSAINEFRTACLNGPTWEEQLDEIAF